MPHSFTAFNSGFIVDAQYEFVKELGQGVSGCVVAARHRTSGEGCAIKKIVNISTNFKLVKQCLREMKLLHHFRRHKNITCLYDMDIVFQRNGNFDEVYLYQELMEADLHIRSGQPLTDDHFQSFVYQALCGLKYIHSANVLHRDIKPANLLVNADCELKICDFGLARGYTPGGSDSDGKRGFMTESVAMRWYRAPETLFSFSNYTTSIDVWSVGCVLAELLGGRPIFQGRNYIDQLNLILHYLGTPSEDVLSRVGSPLAQEYIRSLPFKPRVNFTTLFPHSNALAIDLLNRILCFNPEERISCEQALNHPYFEVWHDPSDEPVCEVVFDSSFEEDNSIEGMKKLIIGEVNSFREGIRSQAGAPRLIHEEDGPQIPSEDAIMSSPVCGHADTPGTISTHSVVDNPGMEREMSDLDPSFSSQVSTPKDHLQETMPSASDPQVSLAGIQPPSISHAVKTVNWVNGSVQEASHGALNTQVAELAPSQTDANPSYPVANALQNDLTHQIARDGHDPVASGGFADIYRAMLQEDGESTKVAIKVVKMYSGEDGDFAKKHKRLRREIKVWLDLRHVNVLPLLGTTMGFGRFPAMVCPWAENGTLTSYLGDRYDGLSVVELLSLLNHVAAGLQYLHSCSVMHGDLSGSNVLICENGRACIADFGLSMLLTELGASTFVTSFHARGTLRWTAPELLDLEVPEDGMEEESPRSGPTTQSDVYSFGSIMLQILSGKVPYHYYTREAQVIHAVSRGMTPRRPSSELVTEHRWAFMQRCWFKAVDGARTRPSSEEIVEFTRKELSGASVSES